MSARIRLQEKQFDAIINVWEALTDAIDKLQRSVPQLQQYADFTRMDNEAKEKYLSEFDLQGWQKKEILSSSDVQESLSNTVDRMRFSEALSASVAFDKVTRANELFFEPAIGILMGSIGSTILQPLINTQTLIDGDGGTVRAQAWEEFQKEMTPLFRKLMLEFRELLTK